jgi:hypothetical protein
VKTKSEAYREAREKRSLLKDAKKWKIGVWENLGWHWALHKGRMSLHYSDGKFFALLASNDEYVGVGATFWSTRYHSTNPNRVVSAQLKAAKEFLNECQKSVDSVEA